MTFIEFITWHCGKDIISAEESTIISLSCITASSSLNSDGTPFISNYELQSLEKDDEKFTAILDFLKNCEYRQDIQNLFPWAETRVHSDSSKTVQVFLVCGSKKSDTRYLVFHEDGQIVVNLGANYGFRVYHAVDDSILDKLSDYVQKTGIEN